MVPGVFMTEINIARSWKVRRELELYDQQVKNAEKFQIDNFFNTLQISIHGTQNSVKVKGTV
jgi:hypothetical protein